VKTVWVTAWGFNLLAALVHLCLWRLGVNIPWKKMDMSWIKLIDMKLTKFTVNKGKTKKKNIYKLINNIIFKIKIKIID